MGAIGACNGICYRYKAIRKGTLKRYGDNFKRYTICDIRIMWDGIRCPCCNYKLKVKSQDSKFKKVNEVMLVRY